MSRDEHRTSPDPEAPGDTGPATRCPAVHIPEARCCDPGELVPLIDFLQTSQGSREATAFPRGTVLPDGRLDLCKQAIGPGGAKSVLAALADHPHIHSVLLGTNALGNEGARAVADYIRSASGAGPAPESPSNRTVYLGCNRIDEAGTRILTEALEPDRSVAALWLKRNPIAMGGARAVAAMLERNQSLRTLDLFNTGIGDRGAALVAEALTRSNRTVKHVYLGGNGAGRATAAALAECLEENATLASLYLSINRLGDEGASILARGLRQNRTLTTLSLASNDIGPDGAAELVAAIAQHPALHTLDLGWAIATRPLQEKPNRLGNQGAKHIAQLVARNQTLRRIDLYNNHIRSRGAYPIMQALEHNLTLVHLGLRRYVARTIRRRMRTFLERNRARNPNPYTVPPHIAAIRSVYRTLPPELQP